MKKKESIILTETAAQLYQVLENTASFAILRVRR